MSGIWIRTQDKKKIVYAGFVEICNLACSDGSECSECEIITKNSGNYITLSKYSNTEKALKVLDKIQRHIEKLFTNTNDGNTNYHMFKQVFEMPQDDEV